MGAGNQKDGQVEYPKVTRAATEVGTGSLTQRKAQIMTVNASDSPQPNFSHPLRGLGLCSPIHRELQLSDPCVRKWRLGGEALAGAAPRSCCCICSGPTGLSAAANSRLQTPQGLQCLDAAQESQPRSV